VSKLFAKSVKQRSFFPSYELDQLDVFAEGSEQKQHKFLASAILQQQCWQHNTARPSRNTYYCSVTLLQLFQKSVASRLRIFSRNR